MDVAVDRYTELGERAKVEADRLLSDLETDAGPVAVDVVRELIQRREASTVDVVRGIVTMIETATWQADFREAAEHFDDAQIMSLYRWVETAIHDLHSARAELATRITVLQHKQMLERRGGIDQVRADNRELLWAAKTHRRVTVHRSYLVDVGGLVTSVCGYQRPRSEVQTVTDSEALGLRYHACRKCLPRGFEK